MYIYFVMHYFPDGLGGLTFLKKNLNKYYVLLFIDVNRFSSLSNYKVSTTIYAFLWWRLFQMLQPFRFIAISARWPPKAFWICLIAYLNQTGCACQSNFSNFSFWWLPMRSYHFITMAFILQHWIWRLLRRLALAIKLKFWSNIYCNTITIVNLGIRFFLNRLFVAGQNRYDLLFDV